MTATSPRALSRVRKAANPQPAHSTRRAAPALAGRSTAVRGPRRFVLWLPLTFLAWLLAPFVLLLAPIGWLATPRRYRTQPYIAAYAIGCLLLSLSGTAIEVDTPDVRLSLRII
jgi:hypothetical protein